MDGLEHVPVTPPARLPGRSSKGAKTGVPACRVVASKKRSPVGPFASEHKIWPPSGQISYFAEHAPSLR